MNLQQIEDLALVNPEKAAEKMLSSDYASEKSLVNAIDLKAIFKTVRAIILKAAGILFFMPKLSKQLKNFVKWMDNFLLTISEGGGSPS